MRIIIGGSGSTGSSLLKNILSRHPLVFSGSETALFTKKELYQQFAKYKSRMLFRFPLGLKSYSYHMYNGVDLLHREYGHTIDSIKKAIHSSKNFQEFSDRYFEKGISKSKKVHWLEKTPANAFLFRDFLDIFSESHVILITRNPYDTLASLMKRGYNAVYASGIYLLNNAAALGSVDNTSFHMVRYENLVEHPQETIGKLCTELGLKFFPEMLSSGNEYDLEDTKIGSWAFDETEDIRKKSKSTYATLSMEQKATIDLAIKSIGISRRGKKYFGIEISSFEGLLENLGYEIIQNNTLERNISKIKQQMIMDRALRIAKFYPTGIHYPLILK